jgi:hypothetical protein
VGGPVAAERLKAAQTFTPPSRDSKNPEKEKKKVGETKKDAYAGRPTRVRGLCCIAVMSQTNS